MFTRTQYNIMLNETVPNSKYVCIDEQNLRLPRGDFTRDLKKNYPPQSVYLHVLQLVHNNNIIYITRTRDRWRLKMDCSIIRT